MSDRRRDSVALSLLVAVTILLVAPSRAAAQEGMAQPIGRFVFDVRGSISPFGQNAEFSVPRGVDPGLTPGLGLGAEIGAHIYLLRWRVITFGLGASVHASRGDRSADADDTDPNGPTIRTQFAAIAPQLSLNFGGRDGWSYLSGGVGSSRLWLGPIGDTPTPRRTNTLNYGGGARWFTGDHLALSLDLRFYALTPLPATETQPGSPRMTLMVLSVGAAFK